MILGDALGTLNPRRLAGVDMAMECGYQAAFVLAEAFKKKDFSQTMLNQFQARMNDTFVMKDLYGSRYFRQAFIENPRLLGEYLPTVAKAIDNGNPLMGPIQIGLANPLRAITDALRVKTLFDGNTDIGAITYKPCYQHIVPDFKPPVLNENTNIQKSTIYSRPDAVFYANTKYHEGNEHIDEFNAQTCVACISRYDALGKDVPCVSDCTAEVHRVDEINGGRRHGMSLENCVQCRTCEMICPEVNLRVNPTEQGSGPDFSGL
jgi:electron-transferring-flavoprotein dehydrogenase